VLSTDYLNEQGKLIGILLLGWRNSSGTHHTVPRNIIPVSQDVYSLPDDQVVAFHNDGTGRIQLHYFSQVIGNAGSFSVPLIESIIEQLEPACSSGDKQRLCVLRQALMWQRTVGGMRL
jgi:hypothetical protein